MPDALQSILSSVTNPDQAAAQFERLVASLGLYGALHTVGMAALALFALAEVYRIWIGGGERELAMLAAKIAVVSYLITGSPSPIEQLTKAAYRPFAELGITIASQGGGQAYKDLVALLGQSLGVGPRFSFWDVMSAVVGDPSNLINVAMWALIFTAFILVFALVLALYLFAVLGSRVFILIAILFAPLMLPMMLWRPVASFVSRWIGVVLHAMFMPIIGAITLYAALELGMLTPLQSWASCVSPNSPGAQCVGGMIAGMVAATIGGLVALFLMFSVDRVVTSLIGAAEVTATGLVAARWAGTTASAPLRAMRAAQAVRAQEARAMRPRAEVVLTQDFDTGRSTAIRRITAPVETPQL